MLPPDVSGTSVKAPLKGPRAAAGGRLQDGETQLLIFEASFEGVATELFGEVIGELIGVAIFNGRKILIATKGI